MDDQDFLNLIDGRRAESATVSGGSVEEGHGEVTDW
jgi:hypothetical protein